MGNPENQLVLVTHKAKYINDQKAIGHLHCHLPDVSGKGALGVLFIDDDWLSANIFPLFRLHM